MYGVVQIGGHQYRVSAGDVLDVEKLSAEEGKNIFDGSQSGYAYSRIGNPSVRVLEEKILEGEAGGAEGFDALATNSGMSAIALVMLHLATHETKNLNIILSPAVYGGTYLGYFVDYIFRPQLVTRSRKSLGVVSGITETAA